MIRCRDCKHWGVSEYKYREQRDGTVRVCDVLAESGLVDLGLDPDIISTEAEFGCVLGEARELEVAGEVKGQR